MRKRKHARTHTDTDSCWYTDTGTDLSYRSLIALRAGRGRKRDWCEERGMRRIKEQRRCKEQRLVFRGGPRVFILYKTQANDLGLYVHEWVYFNMRLFCLCVCGSVSHRWPAGPRWGSGFSWFVSAVMREGGGGIHLGRAWNEPKTTLYAL